MRYLYRSQDRCYMFYNNEPLNENNEITIIIATCERPFHADNWKIVGDAFTTIQIPTHEFVSDYECLESGFIATCLREIVGRYLIGERIA